MKTGYKRLPFETLVNARDLGGYPTRDGRVTKYGRFIRSELPVKLSEKDIGFLRDYGVRLALDFRMEYEADSLPSSLETIPWLKYIRCSMSDKRAAPPKKEDMKSSDIAVFLNPEWLKVYISMAESGKDWVKKSMEIVAAQEGAVIYHCMTGKDRTGLFSAMLLGLCGAYPADIISDYSISQINLRPFYMNMMRFPGVLDDRGEPDLSRSFFQTRPETMHGFLEYIDSTYGNMEEYLLSCGLSRDVLERIKTSFTEDAEI